MSCTIDYDVDEEIRRFAISNYPIRADIREALEAYADKGRGLGDFLTAIVENDLFEAVSRADYYNLISLRNICSFIYTYLPASCWGNPAKVQAHYAKFHQEQT